MFTKPFPRIVAAAVIAMIATAVVLTFTRGESPVTDTASATLPGVSDTSGPVVVESKPKPKPTSPASADAAERDAQNAANQAATKAPAPSQDEPTSSPTTKPPKDPDPKPTPSPTPTRKCGLLVLLGCKP